MRNTVIAAAICGILGIAFALFVANHAAKLVRESETNQRVEMLRAMK